MAPRDDIGRAVLALRVFRGWSRNDLAHRADVSPSTIQRLEAGDHHTEASVLARVAAAFGGTPHRLRQVGRELREVVAHIRAP